MNQLIPAPSAFLPPTKQLESQVIVEISMVPAAPATAPADVIWWDSFRAGDVSIPDGFEDIDSIVEEQEMDSSGRAGLENARKVLSERLTIERLSLAYLRLRRGWSQKRLAEAIGTSQPHIARIEAGRDNVLLKTANLLATALGASLDEINEALGFGEPSR